MSLGTSGKKLALASQEASTPPPPPLQYHFSRKWEEPKNYFLRHSRAHKKPIMSKQVLIFFRGWGMPASRTCRIGAHGIRIRGEVGAHMLYFSTPVTEVKCLGCLHIENTKKNSKYTIINIYTCKCCWTFLLTLCKVLFI